MNTPELIWHLVELLLEKENNSSEAPIDKSKTIKKPNDQKPKKA